MKKKKKPLTVYVVDDDLNVCQCFEELINWPTLGCEPPIICHNGESALAKMNTQPPDLVISDLKMPVMDGATLCREIRRRNAEVEIIFLSAYEDFATAQLALKYGVRDYILKPLTRDTLRSISDLVRSLALARQSHSRLQQLTQPETVTQIRTALQNRDAAALEPLLEPLREYADDDPVQTANLCIFLLQILHDLPHETDFSAYRAQQAALMALPTGAQRVDYVCACYAEAVAAPPALPDIVERVHRLVEQHCGEPDFNVSTLAQEMHFSSAYLGRVFAEHTGGSLMDYILDRRIKRACRLLSRTLTPIAEVAAQCGYANGNYFTKAFRSRMGVSPSEYRRENYHESE